jgi:hypothetical protein
MRFDEQMEEIKSLKLGEKRAIVIDLEGAELYIVRPETVPSKLKNKYDPSKNFQIWLNQNFQSFKPNHLRVLIDLSLKVRAQPKLKEKMLLAFDQIFYGNDPLKEVRQFEDITFPHFLNSMDITAVLSQLFIIEQELNYSQKNFNPNGLFFQGWVREFIDGPKAIEIMCMSAARGLPPMPKYTSLENKKMKKYRTDLEPLWYLKG